jgi:hypothetical protein
LGDDWTIEICVNISMPSTRTKVIGTTGWGLFVTPQSEVDYGSSHRLEFIQFNTSGGIVERKDCGPIAADTWTYVYCNPFEAATGTTVGASPSFNEGGAYLYSLSANGSALTIGGDASGAISGYIDEVRVTKGEWRPYPWTVPPAPFPDA